MSRWLALGGVVGPLVFAIVLVVCGALRADYSHTAQLISELGATGTPHAALMNRGGFVPTGLLIGCFGLSLALRPPAGRASRGTGVLVGLFGLALVLAGSLPCAPGCPQDEPTLHDRVSVAGFVSAIAGIALAAHRFRFAPGWRSLWPFSALASAAAAGFLAALAASLDARALTGLWQRLLVGTLFLWCAVVGARAFGASERAGGPEAH